MKKTIIALSLLVLAASCTKKNNNSTTLTTGNDSSFNGSYIQLTIGNKYFKEKDVAYKGQHLVTLTANNSTGTPVGGGSTYNILSLTIQDAFGIYGLGISGANTIFASNSNTTGNYSIQPTAERPIYQSIITQANPLTIYSDTSGTINVTHNGSDYIEGTINTTFYANGYNYPTSGSFKIFH